jgi:hypothetical protein
MVAWFGPLERQLKENLFWGLIIAKYIFEKGPTATFLGDCGAAENSAAAKSQYLVPKINAIHSIAHTTCYANVKH